MEKINHWNESNTTALIEGISGIAGNIINKQKVGAAITSAEQQVANLSQQTLQALGLANQQQMQNDSQLTAYKPSIGKWIQANQTLFIVLIGVLSLIIFMIIKKRK